MDDVMKTATDNFDEIAEKGRELAAIATRVCPYPYSLPLEHRQCERTEYFLTMAIGEPST